MSGPVDFAGFKANVLRFVERCGVSDGVFDAAAWEASGETLIRSEISQSFIVPPGKRRVVTRSLDERRRDNDWAFASTPGGCESLEGGHSAVETLFFLGELDRLTEDNRRAWVESFNRYQDRETGYYLGPYMPARDHRSWRDGRVCTHPWDHMHDHLIASLCPTLMLLGGRPKIPLSHGSMTGRFLDRAYLEHFLNGRDWNENRQDLNFRRANPWWMGNEFWYPGCILWQISVWEAGTPEARLARQLLDDVWYAWHDRNFGVNGFWYGDLDGDRAFWWHGRLPPGSQPAAPANDAERQWTGMAVMGGAHQLWLYDFDGHPIPEAVRHAQTDSMLMLQNHHHRHFGIGDADNPDGWSCNCTDVDCMTVLAMNYQRQDYRRADIAVALRDAMRAILTDRIHPDGVLISRPGAPFMHNFNSYATFSPGDAANLLDQSFYLWAAIAACSVVRQSDSPELRSFLDHHWPQVPSHWLWVRQGR